MNNRLKKLMKELGDAINESLGESEQIADAIGRIKASGYDVFLVLEATIGFNKRNGEEDADEDGADSAEPDTAPRTFQSTGKVKFTTQDQRFLRALKIAIDEESR